MYSFRWSFKVFEMQTQMHGLIKIWLLSIIDTDNKILKPVVVSKRRFILSQ